MKGKWGLSGVQQVKVVGGGVELRVGIPFESGRETPGEKM